MTAMLSLQAAMRLKALASVPLQGIIGSAVFDMGAVPQGQAYPYITIGDTQELDFSTFSQIGYEDDCTLHIWSSADGNEECFQILKCLNDLFNRQPLTMDGFVHIGTWLDYAGSPLNDPGEDDVRHLPVRYRARAQSL